MVRFSVRPWMVSPLGAVTPALLAIASAVELSLSCSAKPYWASICTPSKLCFILKFTTPAIASEP